MSPASSLPAAIATSQPIHNNPGCSSLSGALKIESDLGLRIAALFVILVGSTLGALFPVLARNSLLVNRKIPHAVFE